MSAHDPVRETGEISPARERGIVQETVVSLPELSGSSEALQQLLSLLSWHPDQGEKVIDQVAAFVAWKG